MDRPSSPQEEPSAARLEILAGAAASVLGTLRLDEVLPRVLGLAREALEADAYAVWRLTPSGAWHVLAQSGLSDEYVRETTTRLPPGAPLRAEPLLFEDPDAARALARHRDLQRREGIASLLVMPLILDGAASGSLAFYYRSPRRFARADVASASLAASLAAGAIMNAELYAKSVRTSERYRFLADHAHDVVVRLARDGTIIDVSPTVERVLGHAPATLIGASSCDSMHPQDASRMRGLALDALEAGLQTARVRHRDGRWIDMEAAVRVVRDAAGEPTEVVASLRDITVRKAIERDLRMHERVLENMVEGVNVSTRDGTIIYTNAAEDRMFGYEPGELIGKHVKVLNEYAAEENERTVRSVIERLRTNGTWQGEFRNVRKDGSSFVSLARITSVDLDGEPHWLCVQEDVTDRKRVTEEAETLRAQLIQGEKLAALGQLVSGVAHELRTPLTFLNNNAFLLRQRLERAARRGAPAAEALREAEPYLDEITGGVDRINALVSDLRRYTRARSDRALAETRLERPTSDAVELFRAANRGAHPVLTELAPTAPIRGNAGSLQQLVLNLLQNAVEASAPGRPVRVLTRDAADGVVLEVSDEGVGIPESVRARMFEPLFTTKAEGTGLGLSIVKRIIEEHGARIECDSAPGKGSTFRVVFPRAA